MAGMEESVNWKKRYDIVGPISGGFPYNEGFPVARKDADVLYEVITSDGKHHVARILRPPTIGSDNLKWQSEEGKEIHKDVVVAWREIRRS